MLLTAAAVTPPAVPAARGPAGVAGAAAADAGVILIRRGDYDPAHRCWPIKRAITQR